MARTEGVLCSQLWGRTKPTLEMTREGDGVEGTGQSPMCPQAEEVQGPAHLFDGAGRGWIGSLLAAEGWAVEGEPSCPLSLPTRERQRGQMQGTTKTAN